MEHEIAQLRHLYAQMVGGVVKDSDGAKRIAEGLLSPVIQKMERLLHGENESIKLEATPVAYMYHDAEDAHSANPMLHSTMLVFACDRRTGYANETPLYTVSNSAAKQIEALQSDADRYRWLASQVWQDDRDGGHSRYFTFPHVTHVNSYKRIYFKTVDEAIDAARARLGEGVSDD